MTTALPREAPGRLLMPLDAFATAWESRPSEPVLLGLRFVSARDRIEIRKEVHERMTAPGFTPDGSSYEETAEMMLMRLFVARGLCDPNDALKAHPVLPFAHEQVWFALTDGGVRLIFDALLRCEVEKSPRYVLADGADVVELVERIGAGEHLALPERDRETFLRHAMFLLDILRDV